MIPLLYLVKRVREQFDTQGVQKAYASFLQKIADSESAVASDFPYMLSIWPSPTGMIGVIDGLSNNLGAVASYLKNGGEPPWAVPLNLKDTYWGIQETKKRQLAEMFKRSVPPFAPLVLSAAVKNLVFTPGITLEDIAEATNLSVTLYDIHVSLISMYPNSPIPKPPKKPVKPPKLPADRRPWVARAPSWLKGIVSGRRS